MRHSLNFDWSFIEGFEEAYLSSLPKNAKRVDLPHNAVDVPLNYFDEKCYQKLFTYEKRFDLDDDKEVKILHFDGVMLQFHLYVNDVDFGNFISGCRCL